ncbi:acyl carrier protein [Paenibacillus hamazuiensis]|uniref:acyl carrier protein n=1 Tax=Paenibacillus hamazuiensis TaxID=2936508 RepID=UPI00200E494B|nr:acyl carrier protein [Paenibacillus hamazuiensis]
MTGNLHILDILAKVLKRERAELERLDPDESLLEYNLSSVVAVELIVELELAFSISVEDDDLTPEQVSTLRRINQLVDKYKRLEQSAG